MATQDTVLDSAFTLGKASLAIPNLPGVHRAVEPPVPIPNTEVKRCIADDSVGSPHVKVGQRQAPITQQTPCYNLSKGFRFLGALVIVCWLAELASVERNHRGRMVMKAWILAAALGFSVLTGSAYAADQKIDLNTATPAQLESVKGIGPKMAAEIIKYRTEHHGFKSIDELKEVRGVGDKTFNKLSPHLTVSSAPEKSKK